MIPSTTLSTPSLPPTRYGFPARPLSANFSSPPVTTSIAQRRRNNKNLSLCLSPTDQQLDFIPPSTPFLSTTTTTTSQHQQQTYYQHGPISILPGLYLGDEHNASNIQQLKDLSIHCVINVAAEVDHPYAHLFQPWDHLFFNNSTTSCPSLSPSSSSSSSSSTSTISNNSTLTLPSPPPAAAAAVSVRPDSVYSTMGYKKRPWHHHILDDDNDNDNNSTNNNNNQSLIQRELHAAVMDVARARESGRNVLVHCQCGLARSATVVVAYVMYELSLSMSTAVLYVKNHAPHINPNLSLMYRLREYELWLSSSKTMTTMTPATPKTTTITTTTTHGSHIKSTKKLDTVSAPSFLKKHQALVARCKSFKFNKSSSSPYHTTTTSLRQDLSWRSSSSSK